MLQANGLCERTARLLSHLSTVGRIGSVTVLLAGRRFRTEKFAARGVRIGLNEEICLACFVTCLVLIGYKSRKANISAPALAHVSLQETLLAKINLPNRLGLAAGFYLQCGCTWVSVYLDIEL